METSLKTGFAQISLAAQKSELPKIWGGAAPPPPPGPYAYETINQYKCERHYRGRF